jgi:hypothetical protein
VFAEVARVIQQRLPKLARPQKGEKPPADPATGDKAKKLRAFKGALLKHHICQTFAGKDQLATKVVADIGRHTAMQNAPRVGPGIPVQDIGLESLVQDIGLESLVQPVMETSDEWNERRNAVYQAHRDVFLTHIIRPSSKPGQRFDVFIYLTRHKSEDFTDVLFAEFFLGPYWENKVFPAVAKSNFIGISTSAYGTFLCICRVTFKDMTHLYLDLDFETQRTGGAATS